MSAHLTSKAKYMLGLAAAVGLSVVGMISIISRDFNEQAQTAPRIMPRYNAGNPLGYSTMRPFQNYGAPFWGGVGSNVSPPISDEEFRVHFYFGSDKIAQVLHHLQFPATAARVALGLPSFPIRFENGVPVRWTTQETALLVFLKRLRTRGSTVMGLEQFFGRSVGWISEVFNSVLSFINVRWVPIKVQSLDSGVFNRFRLQDYADCLFRNGLRIPDLVGFVDGTFHEIYRPGRDGYDGLLQRLFYSGAKKAHGLLFEMITFPDGMIGRAFGPISGRHHDSYAAQKSRLLALLTTGALRNRRLFGDKAYVGFGANIVHPFIAAIPGTFRAWWNSYTSGYRIEVEHDIGNLYSQCALLQHEMCLENQLPEVWFQVSVLMHNIHTCVYHNSQTALRFQCGPPSLSDYMR